MFVAIELRAILGNGYTAMCEIKSERYVFCE
jgi:hypothetical protein